MDARCISTGYAGQPKHPPRPLFSCLPRARGGGSRGVVEYSGKATRHFAVYIGALGGATTSMDPIPRAPLTVLISVLLCAPSRSSTGP